MTAHNRIRKTPTALFAQFPANGRTPFKQVLQATWMAFLALLAGICFVLAIAFTADGKPTDGNGWYRNAPTLIAVGAVVLRGSLAALLGMTLYQKLWKGLATSPKATDDPKGGLVNDGAGLAIVEVDALHLASRLAVGMLAHPRLKAGWIIGALGLVITSAVQPVLQSAISVHQETYRTPVKMAVFHPQLNGSLATSCTANTVACGASPLTRKASLLALMGKDAQYKYTNRNVTGVSNFGPVKYVDVKCEVEAFFTGNATNAAGWDFYNFTYRFPEQESFANLSLYEPISIDSGLKEYGRVEIKASMFNSTHYLNHKCLVQSAIGNCATKLVEGFGKLSDLTCTRDRFINIDDQVQKEQLSFFEPDAGVVGVINSFLETFGGLAQYGPSKLNFGQSLFMLGGLEAFLERKSYQPKMTSDLISHMQRVLWNTPILANFTTLDSALADSLTVPMTVLDERRTVLYKIDKLRIYIVLAVLLIIAICCLAYLSLSRCNSLGRLVRDSLVHSLTVAGPCGPAIKGACLAGLEDIIDKAGDERLSFGVLSTSTQSNSGHLGFAERSVLPGGHEGVPVGIQGKPERGMWYGGVCELRKRDVTIKEL